MTDLLLSHPFPRVTIAELSWLVFCLWRQSLATAYVGLFGSNPDYLALDLTLVDWMYQISLSSSGLSSGQILAIYLPTAVPASHNHNKLRNPQFTFF